MMLDDGRHVPHEQGVESIASARQPQCQQQQQQRQCRLITPRSSLIRTCGFLYLGLLSYNRMPETGDCTSPARGRG